MKKHKVWFLFGITILLVLAFSIGNPYTTFYSETVNAHDDHEHIENINQNSQFTDSFLSTKNRDRLSICVESYDEALKSEEISKKTLSLIEKRLINNDRWEIQGFDKIDLEVTVGCSFNPILLEKDKKHVWYSGDLESIRIVEEASSERIGVFIVDQEVIDQHFKGTPSRLTPEEFVCESECFEVTTSLYLTGEEVIKEAYEKELKYVMGLDIIELSINE